MLPPAKPPARRKAARSGASTCAEGDASHEDSYDVPRSSAPRGKKPGHSSDSGGQAWAASLTRGAGPPHRRCGCAPSAGAAAPLLLLFLWALCLVLWPCHVVRVISPLVDGTGAGNGRLLPSLCRPSGAFRWPRGAPHRGLDGNEVVIEALESLVHQEESPLVFQKGTPMVHQEESPWVLHKGTPNVNQEDGQAGPAGRTGSGHAAEDLSGERVVAQEQESHSDCGSALSDGMCRQADVIISAQGSLGRRMDVVCLAMALAKGWFRAGLRCTSTGAGKAEDAALLCGRNRSTSPVLVRVLWGAGHPASPGAPGVDPSGSPSRQAGAEGSLSSGIGAFLDYFMPLTMALPASQGLQSAKEGAVDLDVRDEAAPFLAPAHYLPLDLSAHLRMLRQSPGRARQTSGPRAWGHPLPELHNDNSARADSPPVRHSNHSGASLSGRARPGSLSGTPAEGEASGKQRRRGLLWAANRGTHGRTEGSTQGHSQAHTQENNQGFNQQHTRGHTRQRTRGHQRMRQGGASRRARRWLVEAEPSSLRAWVSPQLAEAVRRHLQDEAGPSLAAGAAQCLGQLRPSGAVAELMRWDLAGDRGAQLEASTGLYLEGEVPDSREFQLRAPQGVDPCRPHWLLNCTIFHAASLLLRDRTQTLTAAARWASQAEAVSAAFHPSSAPRLLLPTQRRVHQCSARDPPLPVRHDTISVREQERQKRALAQGLLSSPSAGGGSGGGAGAKGVRELRPWELGVALALPEKLKGQPRGAKGQAAAGLTGTGRRARVLPRRSGAHRRRLLFGLASRQWSAGLNFSSAGVSGAGSSRARLGQERRQHLFEDSAAGLAGRAARVPGASAGPLVNPPPWSSAQAEAQAGALGHAQAAAQAAAQAVAESAHQDASLCSQLWLAELFLLSRARGLVHLAPQSLEARFIRAQSGARSAALGAPSETHPSQASASETSPFRNLRQDAGSQYGTKPAPGTAPRLAQQAQNVRSGPGELGDASGSSRESITQFLSLKLPTDSSGMQEGGTGGLGRAMRHGEASPTNRGGLIGTLGYSLITQTQWARFILVDEDLGFLYCHIPKVASSRWKEWLYALKNATVARQGHIAAGESASPEARQGRALSGGSSQVGAGGGVGGGGEIAELQSWFSEAEAVRQLARRDLLKFVFVRNPFSRLASAYFDKHIAGGEQKDRRYWNQLFFQSCMPVEPALPPGQRPRTPNAMGFTEFVERLRCASRLYRTMEPHVAPQAQLCNLGAIQYDFVGRMERLQEDAAAVVRRLSEGASARGLGGALAQRMEAEGVEHFRSRSKHATHADSLLKHLYRDQDMIEKVAHLYASDFLVPLNNISYSTSVLPKP